ncbi:MAG: low temperature requirement protein A [Actinomycetota bacterium]
MAITKWQPPVLRHLTGEHRVVWLELYFDLIYVAALIQLGDQLADDISWEGVVRFGAVFVLLWWTWTGTTAFMNRFSVDDITHRVLVFFQMFAVGNLALVAVSPIDDRSAWMVVAYVASRLPVIIMYLRSRSRPGAREANDYFATAFAIGSSIWIASLLVPTPARYWMWGAALLMEFLAPIVGAQKSMAAGGNQEHMRERYALFTIIVLGESFVKVLSELADIGISVETQVFGGLAFVIGAALWWTYFDDVADSTIRPGGPRMGIPWVYAHLPLAMAMTALGVASKKIVAVGAFDAAVKANYLWLLVGSIALILLATALLDLVTVSPHFAVGLRFRATSRLSAAAAVLLIPVIVGTSPALLVIALIALVVVAQIAIEVIVATKAEHRINAEVAAHLDDADHACPELFDIGDVTPRTSGCPDCDAKGATPVELRVCLQCGMVGCCDDTPGQHARRHYEETGHHLIASIQPGATWAYCYDHDAVDADWRTRLATAEAE